MWYLKAAEFRAQEIGNHQGRQTAFQMRHARVSLFALPKETGLSNMNSWISWVPWPLHLPLISCFYQNKLNLDHTSHLKPRTLPRPFPKVSSDTSTHTVGQPEGRSWWACALGTSCLINNREPSHRTVMQQMCGRDPPPSFTVLTLFLR